MENLSHYHFTDETATTYQGDEARKRLAKVNDRIFLSDGKGIVEVSEDRWRTAQRFERHGWMEKWLGAKDDRNYTHMRGFDGYGLLKRRKFENAIELGCGPFTNTRLMGGLCSIKQVSLLDPLVEDYLALDNACYDRSRLRTDSRVKRFANSGSGLFRRGVSKLCRVFPAVQHGSIPIKEIFACPIEQMPNRPRAYDLVVLINVIEHCYNLPLLFEKVSSICKPGGLFVFHDHLYDHDLVAKMVDGHHYESGHPLMVDRKVVEQFCHSQFENLFERYDSEPVVGHPFLAKHLTYYFIGRCG
jgi:SAM-dependent methyltransferase